MSEVLKPTGRHVIRLPNGRVCTVATYCASWRMLKTLPDNAQIRGFEHFAEDAGRIRRELMRGLHDRINRHVAGYGVGRIDAAMSRAFPVLGHDVCAWALSMVSATRTVHPCVRHDRLRAAAEFRQGIAAELRRVERSALLQRGEG